ncbi:MAG: Nif3-like dinuclear metal center hexameric protein [Firmicutes bacterium]|nr:Nif3-like dinuclear metal center hexameric protein [Bacillota bacterium]
MENKFKKNVGAVTVGDIVEIIEKQIPVALQEEWDNSGLIIGFEERKYILY